MLRMLQESLAPDSSLQGSELCIPESHAVPAPRWFRCQSWHQVVKVDEEARRYGFDVVGCLFSRSYTAVELYLSCGVVLFIFAPSTFSFDEQTGLGEELSVESPAIVSWPALGGELNISLSRQIQVLVGDVVRGTGAFSLRLVLDSVGRFLLGAPEQASVHAPRISTWEALDDRRRDACENLFAELTTLGMAPFSEALMNAGVESSDDLACLIDTFPMPYLQQQYSFQIGHCIKLQQWRYGWDMAEKSDVGLPTAVSDLVPPDLLPTLQYLGADNLQIFAGLNDQDLPASSFPDGLIVSECSHASFTEQPMCSGTCPCQRTLCNAAARGNYGKTCRNPDPQHYIRFCHNREAHGDQVFSRPGNRHKNRTKRYGPPPGVKPPPGVEPPPTVLATFARQQAS